MSGPRLRDAAALIAAGLPGITTLPLLLPAPPGMPPWAPMAGPLLLLAVAAIAGSWAAGRCGLRMRAPEIGLRARASQIGMGFALGLAIATADHLARGAWQSTHGAPPSIVEGWSPAAFLVGLLYGGVVEEILLRWGAMSLLVLLFSRLFARRAARPPAPVLAAAVLLAAAAFAASHLPALAGTGAALTPPLLLRTALLNMAAGVMFGWLFVRRDLLAAMAAHAAAHAGFACTAVIAMA